MLVIMKKKVLLLTEFIILTLCNGHCEEDNFTEAYKGASESEYELYVFVSNNIFHKDANERFIELVQYMGFTVKKIADFCPDDQVMATLIADKYLMKNVINLWVTSDGDYPDELINRTLTYLGFSTPDITKIICPDSNITYKHAMTSKPLITNDVDVPKNETIDLSQCEKSYSNTVKLVSRNILKYKLLTYFITNFSVDEPRDPEKEATWKRYLTISKDITEKPFQKWSILICLNDYMQLDNKIFDSKEFNNIFIRFVAHCEINKYSVHDLFAVLAPKPFEQENKVLTPVLFYDTPYLLPEHTDIYPNHIQLYYNQFRALTMGLVKFIEREQWKRVALISDSSVYSDKFEDDLTSLLIEKGIIYTVKHCEFTQALISLKKAEVTIIIANVEEKYSKLLMDAANQTKMTYDQGVVWIWRNWPFEDDSSATGDVFSIFSIPYDSTTVREQNKNIDLKTIVSAQIFYGITKINNMWEMMNITDLDEELETNKTNFYSKLRNRVEVETNSRTSWVHIRKISYGKRKIVCSMTVHQGHTGDTATVKYIDPELELPLDLKYSCKFRSYKFYDPCDDKYLLLEMCVVCGFLVAVIVISNFFNKHSDHRFSYRQM